MPPRWLAFVEAIAANDQPAPVSGAMMGARQW